MAKVPANDIEQITEAALLGHGASPEVAASVARAVRVAEQNGNRICGLYYVESYCQQLASGRVKGDVVAKVSVDRPGAVRVDGGFGFAQPAFDAGFATAVEAAQANGVCGYSIEHTHTCTALGYFTERLAEAGLVAIGATNATARVAPPGGSARVLGTNPMALAVPDGKGGVAFQWDFSTSAVALGKITMAAAAGEQIPIGWAVDAEGEPTTDPDVALAGSLASAGGYKGFGLGLMVEVLAAGLTGGRPSTEVPPLKAPEGPHHDLGQFYLLIAPDAFDGDGFTRVVESLVASVGGQPGARLPGRDRTPVEVVDVPDDLWTQTRALAEA